MSDRDNKEKPRTNEGGPLTDRSDKSDRTDRTENKARPMRLRPSGGYRQLRSFQTTTIIYDATVSFCQRFVDKRSRTVDQMVQAARSGRQNIAEGSRASATSSQTELRLVNVARASLDELLLDYEDFLRQRKLRQWQKDDPQAKAVREMGKNLTDPSDQSDAKAYSRWLDSTDPEVVANALICLIHQANFLLDRQIAGMEKQFVQEGGYSEKLYAARLKERKKQVIPAKSGPTDRSHLTDLSEKKICPACGRLMILRTARKGANAGAQFWGCSGYPECKGTQRVDGTANVVKSKRENK